MRGFVWLLVGLLGAQSAAIAAKRPALAPLTLSRAIELALRHHPARRVAGSLSAAARSRVGQAESGYYPRLFAGAQWLGGSINGNAASFVGFPDFPRIAGRGPGQTTTAPSYSPWSNYLTGVSVGVPIWDFGRTRGRVREAEGRLREGWSVERTVRERIILGVRQAFYGVLSSKSLVGVSRQSVTRLRVHALMAKEMVRRGVRPPIEEVRTAAELARARGRLIAANNELRVSRMVLDNALGIRTAQRHRLVEDAAPLPVIGREEDLLAAANRTRPELGELRGRRESLEGRVQAARGGYFPTFSGTASVNLRGVGGVGNYFNYDAGVVMSWPIFEGFYHRRREQEARANLRGLSASGAELRQRIDLEVRAAYARLRSAHEAIDVSRVASRHAADNLQLASARFRQGLSRIIELADAEELHTAAQASEIRARYDFQLAFARLERAVGGRLVDLFPRGR